MSIIAEIRARTRIAEDSQCNLQGSGMTILSILAIPLYDFTISLHLVDFGVTCVAGASILALVRGGGEVRAGVGGAAATDDYVCHASTRTSSETRRSPTGRRS